MTTDAQTFFGAVFKAIACTPNLSDDDAQYESQVIEPCQRIRALSEKLGEESLSSAQIKETLGLLDRILSAKRVEVEEHQARFQEIVQRCHLPYELTVELRAEALGRDGVKREP